MRYLALVAGIFLLSGLASAQTFGSITGEVRDQTGAVAPNAPVSLVNIGTNVERNTTTNESGVYTFPDLIPATYKVRVTATGFQAVESTVEIQVQQTARVDFTLTVGQSSQTIEVSAATVALTTESATVGTVIAEKSIQELPLNGRNYLQLVALAPNVTYGFAAPSQVTVRAGGDRANQNISVGGMRGTWNNYTLDGVANTDPDFNLYIQIPSIDALQEFKVQTGIYPAEFGREAAQINVSTKSGTNDLHGAVFEFLRNDALDAKPYNFLGNSVIKNPYRQNQYGYYLGGPVYIPKLIHGRNKLFFASNWEGYKSRLTNQDSYTVIPDAWRTGDFSQFPTPLLNPKTRSFQGGVYTADPFPGNIIPPSMLDSTSQALLQFLPHANINPLNSKNPASNLSIPEETTVDKNQVTERIDYSQNASSQWFGRFGWTNELTAVPILPQQGSTLATNSKQYMISNAWVVSPNKVNEARFGYTSLYNAVGDILSGKTNVVANLGLPFPAEVPTAWGVPAVSLATNGLSSWGDNTSAPFVVNDSITQGIDNFSWNHGKHSIRFGGEYRYDVFNQYGNQYTRGNPQFNGQFTANPQTLAGGNSAADFVLGDPYRLDLALNLAAGNYTASSVAAYVDDTWKLTPRLTVTLGLRYEYVQPWLDTMGNETNFQFQGTLPQQANVSPSLYPVLVRAGMGNFYDGLAFQYNNTTGIGPAGPVPVARDGRLGNRLMNSQYKNFGPRVGIAWSPDPNWSVRAGFGIFYSQESMNNRFDLNRGTAGRLTVLPNTQTDDSLTYANSFNPNLAPFILNPGLTWAVQQNLATPYSMMYVFNVQRQLGQSSTLEVGYQGVQDRHLQNQFNADAGIPGVQAAQTRVPFPMYSSGIELTESWGTGNYNALATKLTQRYKSGLTTLFAFTYSKALDNGSAIRGTTGDQYPENPYCILKCEYGPSGFNTPLRFVTSLLYELPFGRGKTFLNHDNAMLNGVVGGWQLTTIFTAQSGRPLNTVSWDAAGQIVQPNSNRLNTNGQSPYAANPTANQWLNVSAFQNLVAGQFGNVGRNSLIGPSTWEADFSVFKNFSFRERYTAQFRVEAFNVMNHPALGNPNVNWGGSSATPSALFGTIRDNGSALGTAYAMRQVQLALKFSF